MGMDEGEIVAERESAVFFLRAFYISRGLTDSALSAVMLALSLFPQGFLRLKEVSEIGIVDLGKSLNNGDKKLLEHLLRSQVTSETSQK